MILVYVAATVVVLICFAMGDVRGEAIERVRTRKILDRLRHDIADSHRTGTMPEEHACGARIALVELHLRLEKDD